MTDSYVGVRCVFGQYEKRSLHLCGKVIVTPSVWELLVLPAGKWKFSYSNIDPEGPAWYKTVKAWSDCSLKSSTI